MGRDPGLRDANRRETNEQRSKSDGIGFFKPLMFVAGCVLVLITLGATLKVDSPPGPASPTFRINSVETTDLNPGIPKRQDAKVVDPREMASDPKAFIGVNLTLRGRAINVDQKSDYTWMNFNAVVPGRSTTENLVVEVKPKDTRILSDDCYEIFAIGGGAQQVQVVFTGAKREVPVVQGYAWERVDGRSTYDCALPLTSTPLPRTPTSAPSPTDRPIQVLITSTPIRPAPTSAPALPAPTSAPAPPAPTSVLVDRVPAPSPANAAPPKPAPPAPTNTPLGLPIAPGQVIQELRGSGRLSLTIEGAYASKVLSEPGDPPKPVASAQGTYLLITGLVRNADSTPSQLGSSPFRIRDSQGRIFELAPAGTQAIVKRLYSRQGISDSIPSGRSVQVAFLFDIVDATIGLQIIVDRT